MYNEAEILPLVLKHYQQFCSKITLFDNYSDDGSKELAESMGCTVIPFGERGQLNDLHYLEVKNNCWKGSKADYVIVCDADEVLLIDKIVQPMKPATSNETPTIWKTQGWQIVSDEMPKENITDITNGWPFNNYSKNICFDPKAIQEINFNPGAHKVVPVGNVVYSDDTLYILHYRQLGGVHRLMDRYRSYMSRMSPINRAKGYGSHYKRVLTSQGRNEIRRIWNEEMRKSKPLF
jgi:glycosyltransferase involved in cell wall biosynthesis